VSAVNSVFEKFHAAEAAGPAMTMARKCNPVQLTPKAVELRFDLMINPFLLRFYSRVLAGACEGYLPPP